MSIKNNQDELVNKLYKLNIIQALKNTECLNKLSEQQYKYYESRVIDLKEQLENTPKILKNKKTKLEQEIKEMQDKSNKYFEDYLKGCEDLYKLHKELIK